MTIKVRFKSKKKRNVWLNTRFEMIRQIKEHIEMCNRITGKKTRAYFKIENDTFLLQVFSKTKIQHKLYLKT